MPVFLQTQDPAELAKRILRRQYSTLAAFVTLLYDIAITFDQEFIHFYCGKTSIVRFLWFLNRILVPVQVGVHLLPALWADPPAILCPVIGYSFNTWVGVFNLFIVQTSLALRTAAIYERSVGMTIFIAFLLGASVTSRITLFALRPSTSLGIPASITSSVGKIMCVELISKKNVLTFVGPVILDIILYTMTVVRLKSQQISRPTPGVRHSRSLFSLLFRDGSIYFFVVTAAMIISISGFFYIPLFGAFATSDLYIVACSTACSRLILHLKESSRQSLLGLNQDIPSNLVPSFDFEVDENRTTKLTRREVALGFGYSGDGSPDSISPSEWASSASEEFALTSMAFATGGSDSGSKSATPPPNRDRGPPVTDDEGPMEYVGRVLG